MSSPTNRELDAVENGGIPEGAALFITDLEVLALMPDGRLIGPIPISAYLKAKAGREG